LLSKREKYKLWFWGTFQSPEEPSKVDQLEQVIKVKDVRIRDQEREIQAHKDARKAAEEKMETAQRKLLDLKEESSRTQQELREDTELLKKKREQERSEQSDKEKELQRQLEEAHGRIEKEAKELGELRDACQKLEEDTKVLNANLVQANKFASMEKENSLRLEADLHNARQQMQKLQPKGDKVDDSTSEKEAARLRRSGDYRRLIVEEDHPTEGSDDKTNDYGDQFSTLQRSLAECRDILWKIKSNPISYLVQLVAVIYLWVIEIGLLALLRIPKKTKM